MKVLMEQFLAFSSSKFRSSVSLRLISESAALVYSCQLDLNPIDERDAGLRIPLKSKAMW